MPGAYERSAEWYDQIYGDKAYADEAAAVTTIIETRCANATTLLEVGCGTGGHLQFLRERFACSGVDMSEAMLARARHKLPDLSLDVADMRAFDLGRRFDVVASLFSVIGYVRSVEELQAAVRCMAAHLRPGGILIVEPWFTPDQWRAGQRVHGGMVVDEPALKITRMSVSGRRDRFAITPMHHLVATLERIEYFVETHELFLAEEDEYADALTSAGLTAVEYLPDVLVRGAWAAIKQPS